MLSLLLRQSGLHVAYLGQNIETAGLLQTIRQLSPAAICVSVTMPTYLEATIKLGQQMQEISPARPCLIFGGQAFEQHPDAIAQLPGVYLAGEMQHIVTQIRQMALQQGTHHV
jgi:methanogenic corrinoid protein MtbC1